MEVSQVTTYNRWYSQARRYQQFHSKKGTINRLNASKKGYIAGIMDGEGCLSVVRGNAPQLQVANTKEELIDYLLGTIGAGYKSRVIRKEFNHKPAYHYCLGSWYLYSLLIKVEPYLVIKREQARLLLEMFSLGKGNNTNRKEEIYSLVRGLNKRGIGNVTSA